MNKDPTQPGVRAVGPDLIVTRGGIPVPDQAQGLKEFKEACRRWTLSVSYQEIAHLLSFHWRLMEEAAEHRNYQAADFHKRRHEELHAVLSPPGEKDQPR
jgi:hypothetical protein